MSKGTIEQKERWALDLLTMDKIGAWAITEPNSGSDAFGGMQSTARRDGDEYVLNGSKTFITNGPYADTTVFICKLDDGNPPDERKVLHFVLDKGMPGFEQSKPLRKMGLHSSPTGQLFLDDVRVGPRPPARRDRGRCRPAGRDAAKATFTDGAHRRRRDGARDRRALPRAVPRLREGPRAVRQADRRVPADPAEAGARWRSRASTSRTSCSVRSRCVAPGQPMTLAEASACKLYGAQAAMEVALEAVQLFGGNGYMAEYEVEQLCRDAKVLQIYAGTDEIQVGQIARSLLS